MATGSTTLNQAKTPANLNQQVRKVLRGYDPTEPRIWQGDRDATRFHEIVATVGSDVVATFVATFPVANWFVQTRDLPDPETCLMQTIPGLGKPRPDSWWLYFPNHAGDATPTGYRPVTNAAVREWYAGLTAWFNQQR